MIGANDGRNEKAGRDHRAAESRRSNGLGRANKRIETASGGNHFCRVDLLLTKTNRNHSTKQRRQKSLMALLLYPKNENRKEVSKMDDEKRTKRIWFRVTAGEFAAIQQKQKEANIISREAFLRKLVMEGRIFKLEIPELREISVLLSRCSTNLNQITRRVNGTGRLYAGELSETKQELARVENMMRKIYERLSTRPIIYLSSQAPGTSF